MLTRLTRKTRAEKSPRPRTPESTPQQRVLIVGLRNPGEQYTGSRHNIGGEVIGVLAERVGASLKRAPKSIRAQIAEVRLAEQPVVLAVPTLFMNESGQAVAPLAKYFGVDGEHLLIVHDDIDLPFAKLRAQFGRGPGGNNGVTSVIGSLGSQDFWRLKCGVGRPPGRQDPADFVLRRFTTKERPEADLMVQYAADVAETFVAEGGDAASQRAGDLGAAE